MSKYLTGFDPLCPALLSVATSKDTQWSLATQAKIKLRFQTLNGTCPDVGQIHMWISDG